MVIGISGKKQSGKDTVGKIINILLNSPHLNNEGVLTFLRKNVITDKDWTIKKFADKLKDMLCLLIGCTRTQLEDETFKNTELGEEWWYYKTTIDNKIIKDYSETTEKELSSWKKRSIPFELVKPTPRLLLQLLGTECGREIIHPQIWVNSTFADYKPIIRKGTADYFQDGTYKIPTSQDIPEEHWNKIIDCQEFEWAEQPNWLITDMRFPNELTVIQSYGFGIRVERKQDLKSVLESEIHISETALDNAKFTYTIGNNGTLDDLINQVRQILAMENLLNGYKITNGN